MHEYHLVKSVIKSILEKTAAFKNLKKITYIKLKLGNLKMVSKEGFQKIFKELSRDTLCEQAVVDIEEVEGDILLVENIEADFEEN
ncbi:MAG TPA: hydrogenase maturation nickel metallochaperone HypA [Candidatus Omnitrophica bacterium]|nr:hydrogenase maturation nickel metallochaperone HypA [Candidatus Omnitrophota bacterium]